MDVTEQTFAADVLERSHETPVVVDFWARWCAPCRALTPVLEQAVAERAGEIVLAKVDVDANRALSARFGIHGIPAVKAFRRGQVVAEFTGARPAPFVADFLDGLTGPSDAERLVAELRESGRLPEVVAALDREDHERAFELLLDEVPGAVDGQRDEIRDLMVALFAELGQEHPLSALYRRRLAFALY